MLNTFDDYINVVKSKYELEKNKIYSDYLLKPSSAQLREFCLLIHDNGLSNKDREVFELFFKIKPDSTLRKAIESIDVEKFRKICNFLNGKSLKTSHNSLNLIAILVNYELRPFSYFLKSNFNEEVVVDVVKDYENSVKTLINDQEKKKKKKEPTNNIKKKIVFGFLGLIGIASIGYTAKNIISPEPQCMEWKKDHYEVIECNNINQFGELKVKDIIPFEKLQFELKRIHVTDTTTFFKNDKCLLWYCKVNGKPEFFNTHGLHPETNNALKPVSKYIVEKYVK